MADNFVDEMTKHEFLGPSKESLLEKIMGLEETISRYEKRGLDDDQEHIVHICKNYMQSAKECISLSA